MVLEPGAIGGEHDSITIIISHSLGKTEKRGAQPKRFQAPAVTSEASRPAIGAALQIYDPELAALLRLLI